MLGLLAVVVDFPLGEACLVFGLLAVVVNFVG